MQVVEQRIQVNVLMLGELHDRGICEGDGHRRLMSSRMSPSGRAPSTHVLQAPAKLD